MSDASRRCASCGADAPRPEARFCEHCGAALAPPPVPQEPAPPPPDPFGDVAARFRSLVSHAELARHLAETPAVPELAGKTLPSVLLLLLFGVLGLLASFVLLNICQPLGVVLLVLVLMGLFTVGNQLRWNARTPLVARPALVVELRAQLQAGAERSPANARRYVTLQLQDGTRSEHECFASALAGLEPGALGVAYLKGEKLAAFARLAV